MASDKLQTLKINTNIETPADFNDLHNSKHIMQEIFNNNEIANKLHESTVLIDKYIIAFVKTFLFTNETIDAYLSLADTETICKKDKFLSLYWVAGMTMSQVLREFQESEYYKIIPLHRDSDYCHGGYGWTKTKLEHKKEDHHYKNTNYFIDIVHKKMYFVDPEHQIVYRRGNVINVQYSTPYRSWSHYASRTSGVVYPTWNSSIYSYTNMHAKISLNTNTILKSSNDTILSKKDKIAKAERLKQYGY